MKKKGMVSIIVPVYNAEMYLHECLESIINQTYKNIEIIIVDDGSTDNSDLICKEYIKRDNRIIYIKNDNNGVSYSRNIGIKLANGEFIMFVDSDDYIQLKTIEYSVNYALNNNLDIVRYDFQQLYNNRFYRQKNILKTEVVSDSDLIKKEMILSYKFSSACLELIRSSIIGNLRFDNSLIYGEDFKFNLLLFHKAKKVGLINENFYIYRCNPLSITHNISFDKLNNKINSCKNCYSFLIDFIKKNYNNKYNYYSYKRYLDELIACISNIIGLVSYSKIKKIYYLCIPDKIIDTYIKDAILSNEEYMFLNHFKCFYLKHRLINMFKDYLKVIIKFYLLGGNNCEKYNNNISR